MDLSKTVKISDGDWADNEAGRFSYVEDREKCAQDVANSLLQLYDETLGYGSFLPNLEQSSATLGTTEFHKMRIHNEVSDTVDRLMTKQQVLDSITDEEKIDSFEVIVEHADLNRLAYNYFLSVKTVAGDDPLTKAYEIALGHRKDPNLNLDALLEELENS